MPDTHKAGLQGSMASQHNLIHKSIRPSPWIWANVFCAAQVPHQRTQVCCSARLLGEIFGPITHVFDLITRCHAVAEQCRGHS